MIDNVDDTIYHLLRNRLKLLGSPIAPEQIRFQPPDADWRAHLTHLHATPALNVYLVDIRENRKLRSNDMERDYDNGGHLVAERRAPARADCHYLITAWSSSSEEGTDPDVPTHGGTSEEHAILHEVASLLEANQPLVPADVWGGSFPGGFSPDLAVAVLPTTVLPIDGFPKYGEFWGTMGDTQPWKPAVYLVVTVPLSTAWRRTGPPVTTLSGEFRPGFSANGAETVIDVGGHVLHSGDAVEGAWVRLETPAGALLESTTTDKKGRFKFKRIAAQTYVFRAGASGVGADERQLAVPSPYGDYDLHLHT